MSEAPTQGKTEEEILTWFEKELLPQLVAEGRFPVQGSDPKNLVLTPLKYEASQRNTDHFASWPFFLTIELRDSTDNSRSQKYPVIVKFISQNLTVRGFMDTDIQFYNEMLFYNEVTSTFEDLLKDRPGDPSNFLSDICPVCRYANIDLNSPDYGIVIMDDLRTEGFAVAASKVELDLDHCLVSFRKIAKFHALSYAMKIEKNSDLAKLSKAFIECRYQDHAYKELSFGYLHQLSGLRAIDYLQSKKDSEVPESYLNLLKNKILPNPYKMMQKLVTAEEPMAVLCHGDFCRNNILYRQENGRAVDAKLFDYQTWRYGSPSIDLSFFMYMNTTLELREKHFDEIFRAYYDTIISTVSAITAKPAAEISKQFPLAAFQKDFADYSIYGYSVVAFFLPMMMAPRENPEDVEEEFGNLTYQESAENNIKQGGEVVTKRISEIIIDMYRRRFYLD